ncbi:MAG: MBL fold metallo-hydrolase [Deltaproteobacteria bacterium]|nr:MBL fold metallo-hydrolase [Deltaproteobacteria bacterium]
MKTAREHTFGDVTAIELGRGVFGRPYMTVFAYAAGGIAIDSGLPHQRAVAVEFFRRQRTHAIALTHYHEDHSGNAAAVSAATGSPVFGSAGTAGWMRQRFPIQLYRQMVWGAAEPIPLQPLPDVVAGDGVKLLPIATPGHSADHTVYLEPDRGWLFSGDLYVADRIKYFRAEQRLDQEIASLQRVLERDFDSVFCGHHPVAGGGKQRLRNKLDFLVNFSGQVRALAGRGLPPRAIARELKLRETWFVRIWTAGDVSLRNMIHAALVDSDKYHTPAAPNATD